MADGNREQIVGAAVRKRALWLLALGLCLLFAPACGKRRPPQPPVERVPQRTELLSGIQRGSQVILNWPAPLRNASDDSVQSIRRIDVYRLAEAADDPLSLTEEEFSSRATLIGSVPYESISGAEGAITYTDELSLSDPVRLRYAVRYVNAANQRAAFSNFLMIEPATSVSRPPALNPAPEVTQNAVTIRWNAPGSNVDNTTPVNLLGYNIYRSTRARNAPPMQKPLNGERPLNETAYTDASFDFGEEYTYIVRAVSLGTGGLPVESLNSNAVSITPLDTFAPAAPGELTAAPAGGRISIFFPANTERDVVGYNIYRSTDESLPKDRWTQLNRELLTRSVYQDETVQSGVKYFYYVTAVDKAGNVSPPSQTESEVAP